MEIFITNPNEKLDFGLFVITSLQYHTAVMICYTFFIGAFVALEAIDFTPAPLRARVKNSCSFLLFFYAVFSLVYLIFFAKYNHWAMNTFLLLLFLLSIVGFSVFFYKTLKSLEILSDGEDILPKIKVFLIQEIKRKEKQRSAGAMKPFNIENTEFATPEEFKEMEKGVKRNGRTIH